jgi:hypothetical protein
VTCIAIEIDGRELCGSDLLQDLKEQEGQRHQSKPIYQQDYLEQLKIWSGRICKISRPQ